MRCGGVRWELLRWVEVGKPRVYRAMASGMKDVGCIEMNVLLVRAAVRGGRKWSLRSCTCEFPWPSLACFGDDVARLRKYMLGVARCQRFISWAILEAVRNETQMKLGNNPVCSADGYDDRSSGISGLVFATTEECNRKGIG